MLVTLVVTALCAPAFAQPRSELVEPTLAVPGGLAALARAAGLPDSVPPERVLLATIRALWEAPDGVIPAADRQRRQVAEHLRRAEAARDKAAQPVDLVPAFLPEAAWSTILQDIGVQHRSLARAIVENRAVGLVYFGVASLDSTTRAYLAEHPKLIRWLLGESHAALFAAFGRSVHVRNGAVDVPGGSEAVALWAALAGEPPSTRSEDFIRRVLSKDDGRLALLYDGIGHMDEGQQRFALGLQLAPNEREARVRALYNASGAALAQWRPGARPFERAPFDAVHLLLLTRFTSRGDVQGPTWIRFWKLVFDSSFDPATQQLSAREVEEDGRFDAASLVATMAVADEPQRRERAEAWLFANRTFPEVRPAAAFDLVVALQGYSRCPTLLLTLQRMGLSDPATYAEAVRTAARFANANRRMWQFQAALAVVERLAASRSVDSAAANALVRALCKVTPADGTDQRGGTAAWLARDVLGVTAETILPAGVETADRPLETRLLALMAGSVSSPANRALLALPAIEWEGLRYRVDPAVATLRRLIDVRGRQGGPSLDAVLAFARLVEAVVAAPSAREAVTAAERLRAAATSLVRAGSDGERSRLASEGPSVEQVVERTIEWARKLKAAPDGKARLRIGRPLGEVVDDELALVLGSIAYAPHLGDASGTLLMAGDPSRVHDFRLFKPGTQLGHRTAWELPVELRDDEGWRLSGSLLALDTALGRFALKRVAGETMPEGPKLSDAVRQVFTESACLMAPFDLTDASRDALLGTIERGRRRVAALTAGSTDLDGVSRELDEWRAQQLRWVIARGGDGRLELFSLAELARLGGLRPADVPNLDAWGTSGFALGDGLRTAYPDRLPWSTLAGRRHGQLVPALVLDLSIGLAAEAARLHLPGALTPGLLAIATQQLLDTARTAYEDDWLSLVSQAQVVAKSRVEDLVAGLTVSGPLVPDER